MAVESGDLSKPLLNVSKSYEEEHRNMLGSLQTGEHGLLAAAAAHTGLSYARTRTLLRQRQRRNVSEPGTESVLWKSLRWPITKIMEIERIKTPAALPLKAGLAALLAGILCFAPGALSPLNKNGVWAVVTVDIVLETNVGLTLSKGTFSINLCLTILQGAFEMSDQIQEMHIQSSCFTPFFRLHFEMSGSQFFRAHFRCLMIFKKNSDTGLLLFTILQGAFEMFLMIFKAYIYRAFLLFLHIQ